MTDSTEMSSHGAENEENQTAPQSPQSTPTEGGDNFVPNTKTCDSSGETLRKRRCTLEVWDHFTKRIVAGKMKAVCNNCSRMLGWDSKNGTSHLHDHLKCCPFKRQKSISQSILNPTGNSDGSLRLGTYNFDQDNARKELGVMIIIHEYPMSMVDHVGFRRYSQALQPLFKVPSWNTIKSDIFKIYEFERKKTMKLLDTNESRISVTTEMWTSNNQKKGFMTVTTHFIDDSWKLQSRLVRFVYVPCPHTAEVLADVLVDCLLEWNLDRKLSTLTVDNCTTNDAMINIVLGKLSSSSLLLQGGFFHMRCFAHILNMVVRDGLDVIKESIEIIRSSVAFWTGTQKREERFIVAARQLRVPSTKKLELDCKTRWNSTYTMLTTALEYKDVFPHLKMRESLYKKVPSEEDWSKTKVLAEKLKLFNDVSKLFSGSKYSTANLYFPNICKIRLAIEQWVTSDVTEVKEMASTMLPKFEKYWDAVHGLMAIASILDPRYKMMPVEFYFQKIYGDTSFLKVEGVKKLVYDLLREYQPRSLSHQSSQASNASSTFSPSAITEVDQEFLEYMASSSSTQSVRSEFDYYLEESRIPLNVDFDILCWWKTNGVIYPKLHLVARDLLAIPVTTVASESAFSTSGRIVSPHRSRLHSKTIEALMCARDWLWKEIKESSPNEVEVMESEIGDSTIADSYKEEVSCNEQENSSLYD